MEIQQLLDFVARECRKNGIKFVAKKMEYVKANGIPCSGYFDDENKVLAIATKSSLFKSTLIHEYNHMIQYLEQSKVWTDFANGNVGQFDQWLNHKLELSEEILDKYTDVLMAIEQDCEKRTLEFIKNNNINIDPVLYAKQSNAYILSYRIVRKLRKWNKKGVPPYSVQAILDSMPSEIVDIDYALSKEQEELFLKCYDLES